MTALHGCITNKKLEQCHSIVQILFPHDVPKSQDINATTTVFPQMILEMSNLMYLVYILTTERQGLVGKMTKEVLHLFKHISNRGFCLSLV